MCVEPLRTGLHLLKMIDLRVTGLGLLWKMNVFSIYLLGNPINMCWNPQYRAWLSKTIDLRSHMPRFTFKIEQLSHLYPWKPHKYVLKPSEQGMFLQDDLIKDNQFEGSHAQVYSKIEHFFIYLLGNPIIVCWNPQNRACFSKMINLRGHMPRYTLKMNVFPSISLEITINVCWNPQKMAQSFQDNRLEGLHA